MQCLILLEGNHLRKYLLAVTVAVADRAVVQAAVQEVAVVDPVADRVVAVAVREAVVDPVPAEEEAAVAQAR